MIANAPPCDPLAQLWRDYQAEPQRIDLRNQLAEHYRYLVGYQAHKLWQTLPDDVDQDDLEQAGFFGLLEALASFDPDRGVKFDTYAPLRIRGEMLDYLRDNDWVPRLVRSQAKRLAEAGETLRRRLGREGTRDELAGELGISLEQLDRLSYEAHSVAVMSLSHRYFTDDAGTVREIVLADMLPDRDAGRPSGREEQLEALRRLTRGLTRVERLIIILYYWEGLRMKEIGRTLGLSESRVSQLHSQIIARLQESLAGSRGA